MNLFRAAGRSFGLTHRLWFAVLSVLVVTSAVGALSTLLLPFQVTGGRLTVPPPADAQEAVSRAGTVLALFLLSSGLALYLLGGVLGGLQRILRGESVSVSRFFQFSREWFFRMAGWGCALLLLVVGGSVVVGLIFAVPGSALAGAGAFKQFFGFGFLPVFLFLWAANVFSPILMVEHSQGIWASLGNSIRFFFRNLPACLGVLLCAVAVGVGMNIFGLLLEKIVRALRTALSIAPYVPGLPVFFFGLILGIPQAYLTVYFPSLLYTFYRDNPKT
ncbi:MAG: hypothetical protein HYZ93_06500 [Candidatus Omnitrophica bacterium]|nr:hypothetical protein [Candidatus Omnitrophota bacterium]